jgi:hypothetical protein
MANKPENISVEPTFDPQRMQEIVQRLQAEGRMPSSERLNEVLQKHRPGYQKTGPRGTSSEVMAAPEAQASPNRSY